MHLRSSAAITLHPENRTRWTDTPWHDMVETIPGHVGGELHVGQTLPVFALHFRDGCPQDSCNTLLQADVCCCLGPQTSHLLSAHDLSHATCQCRRVKYRVGKIQRLARPVEVEQSRAQQSLGGSVGRTVLPSSFIGRLCTRLDVWTSHCHCSAS